MLDQHKTADNLPTLGHDIVPLISSTVSKQKTSPLPVLPVAKPPEVLKEAKRLNSPPSSTGRTVSKQKSSPLPVLPVAKPREVLEASTPKAPSPRRDCRLLSLTKTLLELQKDEDRHESNVRRFEEKSENLWWLDKGWIDFESLKYAGGAARKVAPDRMVRFLALVDGSNASLGMLEVVIEHFIALRQDTFFTVGHLACRSDDARPSNLRRASVKSAIETRLDVIPGSTRCKFMQWEPVAGQTEYQSILAFTNCNRFHEGDEAQQHCLFVSCRGENMYKPGSTAKEVIKEVGSMCAHLVRNAEPPVFIIKGDIDWPAYGMKWCVSIANNQASTKSLVDVLTLSSKGDDIHVVHIGDDTPERIMLEKKFKAIIEKSQYVDQPDRVESDWFTEKLETRSVSFASIKRDDLMSVPEQVLRYTVDRGAHVLAIGTVNLASRGVSWNSSTALKIIQESTMPVLVSHYHSKAVGNHLKNLPQGLGSATTPLNSNPYR